CVLIAGGEPLVRVKGSGRGGRAQELALRLGRALSASAMCGVSGPVTGLVAGTDGSDGPTRAAGAFFDGTVVGRAATQGLDLDRVLEANDSGSALETLGDLWVTGPTGTNVADVLMVVIPGPRNLA
ncbi:MAG: MOFRL family protein, partial [Steroidobacteraceae bacterium]